MNPIKSLSCSFVSWIGTVGSSESLEAPTYIMKCIRYQSERTSIKSSCEVYQ